jgi:carboxyl-terminal processing protease
VSKNLIFNYATKFRNENAEIADARSFKLSDQQYEDFKTYVMGHNFEYNTQSYEKVEELKKIALQEGLLTEGSEEFERFMEQFKPSKERDLDQYKKEIVELLEDEIVGRYYYGKGRIDHSLANDAYILEAVEILNDLPRYKKILNR